MLTATEIEHFWPHGWQWPTTTWLGRRNPPKLNSRRKSAQSATNKLPSSLIDQKYSKLSAEKFKGLKCIFEVYC